MRVLTLGFLVLGLASPLAAQSDSPSAFAPTGGQGYTYFAGSHAGGEIGGAMNLGAGGEGFVSRSLAVGGDAGYMFKAGRFGNGIGLVSTNVSYHFQDVDPEGRWVPFVTGGYTLAFRSGTGHLVNYGGGLTYWVRLRWGVRAEFRNHQNGDFSMPSFRFGFSFR